MRAIFREAGIWRVVLMRACVDFHEVTTDPAASNGVVPEGALTGPDDGYAAARAPAAAGSATAAATTASGTTTTTAAPAAATAPAVTAVAPK